MVRTVRATRYVTPLREGGSLPALIEADDDGMYVLKFRGAGQGPKALVAELLVGELGRALGLPIPEIVLVELDPVLGDAEPHQEIQDLIKASAGTNIGLDFLPGALAYSPAVGPAPPPELAADVVWFDGFTMNPDRTPQNPNILVWHGRIWLIDHGAALYIHHTWREPAAHARRGFEQIRNHVLLPIAGSITEADARMTPLLSDDLLGRVVAEIPDNWLGTDPRIGGPDEQRRAYVDYLTGRLDAPHRWVPEADGARAA
jgi:HipA-like protein